METEQLQQQLPANNEHSNRILIKAVITAVLILLMLIPTFFVQSLVTEREQRQKEVVQEVSSKWATAQTVSGLYLSIPYTDSTLNDGKMVAVRRHVIVLPTNLQIDGQLYPEERPRSIYKVLLYKTTLTFNGLFKPVFSADINAANLDFANSKLCFNLSDYKGIQEEISANFNGRRYLLNPGLPVDDLGDTGLSVPVSIDAQQLAAGMAFDMQAKLKGSEQLKFLPLGSNSKVTISSKWRNPSFDGNSLPNVREIGDTGFVASWSFNRANLPFSPTFFHGVATYAKGLSFGVNLVQPANQYDKTMRSIKYAILFIGLTFALFFIVELMQKKPFHPVQYVLVGLALVIFYTLLLSISEYTLFDTAYIIAAAATIILITAYAKSHFGNWGAAGVFCSVLTCLYGFIFILIRLEDTALLIGSIGLFIVLALVMYASRKVNWYGNANLQAGH